MTTSILPCAIGPANRSGPAPDVEQRLRPEELVLAIGSGHAPEVGQRLLGLGQLVQGLPGFSYQ